MLSKIHVIDRAAYDAWFESSSKVGPGEKEVAKSKGHELYDMNGCSGCHSMDTDSILVGPSLKGIGTKYDATYLKDAIVNPDKDVPAGFTAGVMPPFALPDTDVKALIDYIKTGK
jgi:cytochrome c551/c552